MIYFILCLVFSFWAAETIKRNTPEDQPARRLLIIGVGAVIGTIVTVIVVIAVSLALWGVMPDILTSVTGAFFALAGAYVGYKGWI